MDIYQTAGKLRAEAYSSGAKRPPVAMTTPDDFARAHAAMSNLRAWSSRGGCTNTRRLRRRAGRWRADHVGRQEVRERLGLPVPQISGLNL